MWALHVTCNRLSKHIVIFRHFYLRMDDHSFSQGVLTEDSYHKGKKKRLISLQICFMSWCYELAGMVFILLRPTLHNLGFGNLYFPDPIVMFIIIPFSHLINDEETKAIIFEEGWYQGLRHMAGIYPKKASIWMAVVWNTDLSLNIINCM